MGGAGKRQREVFYTEGTSALLEARIEVAEFSLPRAARRSEERAASGGGGGGGGTSSPRRANGADGRGGGDDVEVSGAVFGDR